MRKIKWPRIDVENLKYMPHTPGPLEKGIPLPAYAKGSGLKGRYSKYPFAQMEVGDSFFVPYAKVSSFSGTIANFRKSHPLTQTWRYQSRSVEENGVKGVRIWRTL